MLAHVLVEELGATVELQLPNDRAVLLADLRQQLLGFEHPIHGLLGGLGITGCVLGGLGLVEASRCFVQAFVVDLRGHLIESLPKARRFFGELLARVRVVDAARLPRVEVPTAVEDAADRRHGDLEHDGSRNRAPRTRR